MATRGRKSAAALSVVPVTAEQRPAPPEELTEEQAQDWRAIVGRMPADWFTREVQPLLMAYCKHLATFRKLSAVVDGFDLDTAVAKGGLMVYARLLTMRERESRCLASLATRMRLTPQARYAPHSAARAAARAGTARKPWESEA